MSFLLKTLNELCLVQCTGAKNEMFDDISIRLFLIKFCFIVVWWHKFGYWAILFLVTTYLLFELQCCLHMRSTKRQMYRDLLQNIYAQELLKGESFVECLPTGEELVIVSKDKTNILFLSVLFRGIIRSSFLDRQVFLLILGGSYSERSLASLDRRSWACSTV